MAGGEEAAGAVVRFPTGTGARTGGDVDGRLSASATTFRSPGVCPISVKNSDTYASCRTCLADQSGDTRLMASVRGRQVVCEDAERAALQYEPEMPNGGENCQQLSVKGRIF